MSASVKSGNVGGADQFWASCSECDWTGDYTSDKVKATDAANAHNEAKHKAGHIDKGAGFSKKEKDHWFFK